MKTDYDIATWVYRKVKDSQLAKAVTGAVSKTSRDTGSDKEDVIISVLSNDGCGQTQRAYVNVNVYCQDLLNSKTKTYVENGRRLGELASLSTFLFSLHEGDYRAVDKECSQKTYPTNVPLADGRTERYINNRVYLEINNE